jgi:superfamily II DNA or RNA helicase
VCCNELREPIAASLRLLIMQARPYQEELLKKAKEERNIIVYLGTGSGKNFIAVMLTCWAGARRWCSW